MKLRLWRVTKVIVPFCVALLLASVAVGAQSDRVPVEVVINDQAATETPSPTETATTTATATATATETQVARQTSTVPVVSELPETGTVPGNTGSTWPMVTLIAVGTLLMLCGIADNKQNIIWHHK